MSFHWNLSSDEDDDIYDKDDGDNNVADDVNNTHANNIDTEADLYRQPFTLMSHNEHSTSTTAHGKDYDNNDDNGDDDDDNIDWEDAIDDSDTNNINNKNQDNGEEDDEEEEERKPAAITNTLSTLHNLRPVTIDMDQSYDDENNSTGIIQRNDDRRNSSTSNSNSKNRKQRRRNIYRIESFANNHTIQNMLWNYHYTHLLLYTSHVIHYSQLCSNHNNVYMNIAYSLIPQQYHPHHHATTTATTSTTHTTIPTYTQMVAFMKEFYFPLVHIVLQRRQEQLRINQNSGAPPIPQQQQQQDRRHSVRNGYRKRNRTSNEDLLTVSNEINDHEGITTTTTTNPSTLLFMLASYLSKTNDDDPQLTSSTMEAKIISNILRSNNNNNCHKSVLTAPRKRQQMGTIYQQEQEQQHENSVRSSTRAIQQQQQQQQRDLLLNGLLLAMIRSLGWRARLVYGCDPISPDVTIDHPILKSYMNRHYNVFTSILKQHQQQSDSTTTATKKYKNKRQKKEERHQSDTSIRGFNNNNNNDSEQNVSLMWIEILCCNDNSNSNKDTDKRDNKKRNGTDDRNKNSDNSQYRWYHVDPIHQLINQPDQVEALLGQRHRQLQNNNQNTTKRYNVSYVISVEHYPASHNNRLRHDHFINNEDDDNLIVRVTDVTPRYAYSWISSLRKRGMIRNKKDVNSTTSIEERVRNSWWNKTLRKVNTEFGPTLPVATTKQRNNKSSSSTSGCRNNPIHLDGVLSANDEKSVVEALEPSDHLDQLENDEKDELTTSANSEAIPTSKAAFKTHPIYVIPSELGKTEVLHPDAKQRVCGVFKGQLIYRRSDVTTIRTAKKWLYEGRKVRDHELNNPINSKAKRKKPPTKGFKALQTYGVGKDNDGSIERQMEQGSIPLDENDTEQLYGIWQTDEWTPSYVGPNDEIPLNEFKNVELALLNPGLVHIDESGLAIVAKKLGIPYAPCLLGFEGHGGNRTPTIRGIVVHVHNEQLIREAGVEVQNHSIEQEYNDRRRKLLLMWKRLMVNLLTKDRLEREYRNDTDK